MKQLLFILFISLLFIPSQSFSECKYSDEIFEKDNLRIINYLKSLSEEKIETEIKGIILCDGSNPLKGLTYIGKLISASKQYVFLFIDKRHCNPYKHMIAYVWVDPNGEPIEVPSLDDTSKCGAENAHVLTYDVFTYKSVAPGDGVVIIDYPNEEWLRQFSITS